MFLGALWGQAAVVRNPDIDDTLRMVIGGLKHGLSLKEQQQARGYLNYYLSFAGRVHSIVNRALLEPEEGKRYLYALMEYRKIKFRDPEVSEQREIFTDATTNQCDELGGGHASTVELPIIYAETLAALVGIYKQINNNIGNIILFTDNMATLYFIKKGTAGLLYNLSFYCHFLFISLICKARRLAKIRTAYISTKINPADRWSRL